MTGLLPIDGYNRGKSPIRNGKRMLNRKPRVMRIFASCGQSELAENTGDLRPSFYGYYYF
jgi:hypothetical protein